MSCHAHEIEHYESQFTWVITRALPLPWLMRYDLQLSCIIIDQSKVGGGNWGPQKGPMIAEIALSMALVQAGSKLVSSCILVCALHGLDPLAGATSSRGDQFFSIQYLLIAQVTLAPWWCQQVWQHTDGKIHKKWHTTCSTNPGTFCCE